MTKAIIVSNENAYYDFFVNKFPQWNIQPPVANIDEMWDKLSNGQLDVNSEIVVLTGSEFSQENNKLETTVRALANEALVLILMELDYQPYFDKKMSELVSSDGIPCGKFWYVNTGTPVADIKAALTEYEELKKYVSTPHVATTEEVSKMFNDVISQARQSTQPEPTTPTQQPSQPLQAPISQPTINSSLPQRKGFVIASTSSKGGSGKSTVALCTASMFYHASRIAYEQGLRDRPLDVVVVDMDTRDGQVGFFVGTTSPSVLNLIVGLDYSREAIMKNLVKVPRLGIHTLLAPKRAATADYATPEAYATIIEELKTMFDVVILDTSVNYLDPLIKSVVLPISDAVMFVTTLSLGSIFGMTRWVQEVTEPYNEETPAVISKDKIGVVVNQSIAGVNIEQKNIEQAAEGIEIISYIPIDSRAVILATNSKSLDDIVLKHETISPAYFDIVSAINKGLNESKPLVAPLSVLNKKQTEETTPKSSLRFGWKK
jgi:MinD-like ATPase involved in chromosome partitioning or flagellar assembly